MNCFAIVGCLIVGANIDGLLGLIEWICSLVAVGLSHGVCSITGDGARDGSCLITTSLEEFKIWGLKTAAVNACDDVLGMGSKGAAVF